MVEIIAYADDVIALVKGRAPAIRNRNKFFTKTQAVVQSNQIWMDDDGQERMRPLLASSCLFLPLLASSCLFLPLLASSCLFLPLLASSCLFLPLLASSCLFLPLLASSCLF